MALDFLPASTSLVALTRTTAIEPDVNTLSMSCWARLDGSPNSFARIAEKEYNNGNTSPYISYGFERGTGDTALFNIGTSGGLQQAGGNTALSGAWQSLVGIYNGTTGTLYIDGTAEATTFSHSSNIIYHTGAGNFDIGGNSGGGNHWDGGVCEVGVWNVALTTDEKNALAAGCCPLLIRPMSLILYIPLFTTSGAEYVNGLATSYTGTTYRDGPRIIYPAKRTSIVPAAAAPGGGGLPRLVNGGLLGGGALVGGRLVA